MKFRLTVTFYFLPLLMCWLWRRSCSKPLIWMKCKIFIPFSVFLIIFTASQLEYFVTISYRRWLMPASSLNSLPACCQSCSYYNTGFIDTTDSWVYSLNTSKKQDIFMIFKSKLQNDKNIKWFSFWFYLRYTWQINMHIFKVGSIIA